MTQDVRLEQLREWVHTLPGWENATLESASADASFRRYFRASQGEKTAIVMDAPPDKENSEPFIDITHRLLNTKVAAPTIFAENLEDGFLLIEDFGNTPLLTCLTPDSADMYYHLAIGELLKLQSADSDDISLYGEELLRMEMSLMPEWFLRTHLQFTEAELPLDLLEQTFDALTENILQQPGVFVHRDYHSRNLMVIDNEKLGVIDYQDAIIGSATYDLVSLLRDCYTVWPEHRVTRWALSFHKQAIAAGNIPPVDERSFLRWFDLTGLQRHIKVLGIFSRLNHRDGKSNYINDLPLTLSYVLKVGARHPETSQLVEWIRSAGIPERIGTIAIPA